MARHVAGRAPFRAAAGRSEGWTPPMRDPLVVIGQIVAAHGVRGEVRVNPLTDVPARWRKLKEAYIGEELAPRQVAVRAFTKGTMPVLRIAGVTDRDQAEKLRGEYIRVPRTSALPLPPDTYYVWQLQGLAVVDPDGQPLGQVVDVQSNPANDLLVVELPEGKRCLVPAVREFVIRVDLPAQQLTLRPIPGLLE